ncbi:hypothetical protein BDZ45DRAFT_741192 [Acephala macrosclerotiorum]|nr:hypothetical protein BDZ45DRAFT_741192 [Acephala macrosclerotiorum]
MIEAFKDPQTWCYCGIAITTTLPTGGLGAFANIIITGFHFTALQTQLLDLVCQLLGKTVLVIKRTTEGLYIQRGVGPPHPLNEAGDTAMWSHVSTDMVLGFYIIVLLISTWLVKKTGQNLLVMLGFIIIFLRWYLLRQNKRKDELASAGI